MQKVLLTRGTNIRIEILSFLFPFVLRFDSNANPRIRTERSVVRNAKKNKWRKPLFIAVNFALHFCFVFLSFVCSVRVSVCACRVIWCEELVRAWISDTIISTCKWSGARAHIVQHMNCNWTHRDSTRNKISSLFKRIWSSVERDRVECIRVPSAKREHKKISCKLRHIAMTTSTFLASFWLNVKIKFKNCFPFERRRTIRMSRSSEARALDANALFRLLLKEG